MIDKISLNCFKVNYTSPINVLIEPSKQSIQNNNHNLLMNYLTNSALNNRVNKISFGKKSFEQTLKENYFQLPLRTLKNGDVVRAEPDDKQIEAAKSLYKGNNTICIKPTGTGKTADALYVITKNFKEGKRTFYTTPLKALSNDKYREFSKIYGEDNIGILTGDIKHNTQAPIVIMTTEIYRNMALSKYSDSSRTSFDNVKTVVFDEAHYIDDFDRGKIWEESLMLTPKNVQILALSATIGNPDELNTWIDKITDKKTDLILSSPQNRHVPLVFYNYSQINKNGKLSELIKGKVDISQIKKAFENNEISERQLKALKEMCRHFNDIDEQNPVTNSEIFEMLKELSKKTFNKPVAHTKFKEILINYKFSELKSIELSQLLLDPQSRELQPMKNNSKEPLSKNYFELIDTLKNANKLPAIIFQFNRNICNNSSRAFSESYSLTSEKEKKQIAEIIEKYQKDKIYLGKNFDRASLLNGVAPHHAGLLPSYKKLVEELFSKKLLKVVFATSTLSAGINMPAKTVVITQIERPDDKTPIDDNAKNDEYDFNNSDGLNFVPLTPNEFHQMAGRAGRRGIDTVGNVILYNLQNEQANIAKKLILSSPNSLTSKYQPTYNFIVSYHKKSNDDKLMNYFIENTFKVHQYQGDKSEIVKNLKEDFINNRNVLVESDFLKKIDENAYQTTIKGDMLSKIHGYNELSLVDIVLREELKDLTAQQLVGFASSLVGNFDKKETINDDQVLTALENYNENLRDEGIIQNDLLAELLLSLKARDNAYSKLEKANNVVPNPTKTNFLSGFIGYVWANENMISTDYKQNWKNTDRRAKELVKNLSEGDIYKIVAQSIDVLKQIINLSEHALKVPQLASERSYYEELIEKSEEAIKLVTNPPVYQVV